MAGSLPGKGGTGKNTAPIRIANTAVFDVKAAALEQPRFDGPFEAWVFVLLDRAAIKAGGLNCLDDLDC
ncbi:hypothetical protein [Thalassoglobus neptunius]|uniref:hypothetical protein n=1 Tax=Thalassoglobus neptunius TaxID=1938619 RepID=UPI0011B5C72C|nr:hypothetical protein [Thalassoglobus neptunius]